MMLSSIDRVLRCEPHKSISLTTFENPDSNSPPLVLGLNKISFKLEPGLLRDRSYCD